METHGYFITHFNSTVYRFSFIFGKWFPPFGLNLRCQPLEIELNYQESICFSFYFESKNGVSNKVTRNERVYMQEDLSGDEEQLDSTKPWDSWERWEHLCRGVDERKEKEMRNKPEFNKQKYTLKKQLVELKWANTRDKRNTGKMKKYTKNWSKQKITEAKCPNYHDRFKAPKITWTYLIHYSVIILTLYFCSSDFLQIHSIIFRKLLLASLLF